MNSMLMSQQYILNKVSLNTLNKTQTKYKQNMVVYWLADKNVVNRGLQYRNPVFPLGAMVQ